MKEKEINKRLSREAGRIMPDVLASVYADLGLDKAPVRPRWRLSITHLGFVGAGATALLVGALVLPTLINGPIVAVADTYVRLKIVPASLVEPAPLADPDLLISPPLAAPTIDDIPTFSYIVNRRGKTAALDDKNNNGIHAETAAAKMIASGLGLENTLGKNPAQLALSIVRLARQTGYIESSEKGNVVAYRLSGEDTQYQSRLKTQIKEQLEAYFRAELIYGITYEDSELDPADFSDYDDFSDETSSYRNDFNSHRSDHEHDDDHRESNWGDDYDEWMDSHRLGNDDDDESETTTSSEDDPPYGSSSTGMEPPTSNSGSGHMS